MIPSQLEDDCNECKPAYLRHRSGIASAISLSPFLITFAIVGSLAITRIFPKFTQSSRTAPSYVRDGSQGVNRLWHRPKIQIISALSFSLTIAISAVLTELILCEISNVFDADARRAALNFALPTLLLLLIFFLPLLELYSIISSAGWRFTGEGRFRFRIAWILEIMGFAVFALAFWTIGGVLPNHSAEIKSVSITPNHSMIEGSLERLGVAGVTLMALLSGFAAISAVWQMLGAKTTIVTDADIARRISGLETSRDLLESTKMRRTSIRAKLSDAPEPSLWSKAVDKLRPNLDTQELKALDVEIAGLETMVDSLELSLSVLQSRHASQERNKTAVGRFLNLLSYLFSCYCIYRIITTFINVLRRQFSGTHGLPPTDPITMFIALFAKHINPAMNQTAWAHHISFLLSGVILMTSFSAVVQTIHVFSRVTPRNFLHIARSNASLVIAQICGTYVISSALMLRGTMPKEVRNVINDALGSGALDAGWVQKWFDLFFLGAVVMTGQGLWIGRKLGRGNDWDEEFEDLEMGKQL